MVNHPGVKYLDRQCRGVSTPALASYEDTSSSDGATLRFMPALVSDTISAYRRHDDVVPLGRPGEHVPLTLGSWNLLYRHETQTWHGSSGNVDLVATYDVDRSDLNKLLIAFDRVSSNTSAMCQPRRIVMEVGFPMDSTGWAAATATSSSVRWATAYDGIIPIVAVDSSDHISNLDRVICHELTHLMEPELSGCVEEITQLLLTNHLRDDSSLAKDVSLSTAQRESILSINPEYFSPYLDNWDKQRHSDNHDLSSGSISLDELHARMYIDSQALAAEIISETACSRVWGFDTSPVNRGLWPDLDRATFRTVAELDLAIKSPMTQRLSMYDFRSSNDGALPQAPLPSSAFNSTLHDDNERQR
jgi:hypothetical protein